MDCYFAAVEIRDDPSLRGKPVVVGGSPQSRGVVATASYEARKFGVRSAMSAALAAKLCPHAVFIKPRFEVYSRISKQLQELFQGFAPVVEMLSLDEAFLDVTEACATGVSATSLAEALRARITSLTGLTASAGVAPNKMLAKIASEVNKPDGLKAIRPEEAAEFMLPLPVRKIPFVGPRTEERLKELKIQTCADLLRFEREELAGLLGSHGLELWERAQGLDDSPVVSERERKSVGVEHTFPRDLATRGECLEQLGRLASELSEDLKKRKIEGCTLTLKVKYSDFKLISRSTTLPYATAEAAELEIAARALSERTEIGAQSVRLLGLSMAKLQEAVPGKMQPLWSY